MLACPVCSGFVPGHLRACPNCDGRPRPSRIGQALLGFTGLITLAACYGRDYAVPDDVVQLALPALRHRVILTAEAEVEGRRVDELLEEMIRSIEVPRL